MITYITAFIFYTLAMVGILLVGFIVYKKTTAVGKVDARGTMKILDTLQIGPKKQLLVVRIKNEKFLIASGVEHTTFLAKLREDNPNPKNAIKEALQKPQVKAMLQKDQIYTTTDENYSPKYNYNNSENFDEMYATQQAQRHYNELQQARLDKIQKRFKELYEDDKRIETSEMNKPFTRKAMVRQLLKELNETTSTKAGNGFNG